MRLLWEIAVHLLWELSVTVACLGQIISPPDREARRDFLTYLGAGVLCGIIGFAVFQITGLPAQNWLIGFHVVGILIFFAFNYTQLDIYYLTHGLPSLMLLAGFVAGAALHLR